MDEKAKSETIRQLNDRFRMSGPVTGDWLITMGVQSLGEAAVVLAIQLTTQFDAFIPDNDPHGEHDFGSFTLAGHRLYWKIDYYDLRLKLDSPDPANELVTRRVMTILLASEYCGQLFYRQRPLAGLCNFVIRSARLGANLSVATLPNGS